MQSNKLMFPLKIVYFEFRTNLNVCTLKINVIKTSIRFKNIIILSSAKSETLIIFTYIPNITADNNHATLAVSIEILFRKAATRVTILF